MLDDQTQGFQPAFGRGPTQVQIWADPRWQFQRKYQSVRGDQRAALRSAMAEARGKGNIVRATVHDPQRGSFPSQELLSNPTFANGTTGYTPTNGTLSVSDRIMRMTRNVPGGNELDVAQNVTVTTLVPYAIRAALAGFRSSGPSNAGYATYGGAAFGTGNTLNDLGMSTVAVIPASSPLQWFFFQNAANSGVAGDYFDLSFASLARCMLVDNSPNDLQSSQDFSISPWAATSGSTGATITANAAAAPDGTTTADALVENSSNVAHYVTQPITYAASAHDRAIWCCVRATGRNFCRLQMDESGGTNVAQYFNVTSGSGAVGTNGATGANWANRRAFISDLGSGWYLCVLIARKTNTTTSGNAFVAAGSADGTGSYTGSGTSALTLWQGGSAVTSVPCRPTLNTAAVSAGTVQSGSMLNVKGLPASTNGLLLMDDFFEWNGELKQLTSALNSDALGLGTLRFRPGLAGAPADNDPVIVNQPFGKFRLSKQFEYDNQYGLYMDADIELTEDYS